MSLLLVSWPLPEGTTGIAIDVSTKHDKFVQAVVHFVANRGEVLARYVVRCGTRVWCTLLLPAVRTHCATLGLSCAVHDVPRPSSHSRPSRSHVGRTV
jgi:hypothetical protein